MAQQTSPGRRQQSGRQTARTDSNKISEVLFSVLPDAAQRLKGFQALVASVSAFWLRVGLARSGLLADRIMCQGVIPGLSSLHVSYNSLQEPGPGVYRICRFLPM